jgi:hypothetical protein
MKLLHSPLGLLNQPLGYPIGGASYAAKIKALFGANLIGYWQMNEESGTNANDSSPEGNDGTFTGVTLANGAMPAKIGGYAPLFDGANDYVDIYSAGLNSDFNGQLFSVMMWTQWVYPDTTQRQAIRLKVNASNDFYMEYYNAGTVLRCGYVAGGISKLQNFTNTKPTTWVHLAATVSKSADQFIIYLNGTAVGSPSTGIGAWTGNLLSAQTIIGAAVTTPSNVFSGHIGHVMMLNAAATPAQIAQVYHWGK